MDLVPGVIMLALAFGMPVVASRAVETAARRAGLERARALSIRVLVALLAWLATTGILAFVAVEVARLPFPVWPLFPITAFIAIGVIVQTSTGRALIAHTSPASLIGAQVFRVGVELGLYALHARGGAPVQITFEGRNFDILVGLSAPLIAWLVASGRIGRRGIVAWNIVGLAVLANTVRVIASSAPGPLHADWPGEPFTAIAMIPFVWLPAFLMPLAVFLHVASLRQKAAR